MPEITKMYGGHIITKRETFNTTRASPNIPTHTGITDTQ